MGWTLGLGTPCAYILATGFFVLRSNVYDDDFTILMSTNKYVYFPHIQAINIVRNVLPSSPPREYIPTLRQCPRTCHRYTPTLRRRPRTCRWYIPALWRRPRTCQEFRVYLPKVPNGWLAGAQMHFGGVQGYSGYFTVVLLWD
jgi:hypothetical protein